MHTIIPGSAGIGNYQGADGVDLGDVDFDSDLDVVTGFKQGRRVGIALNPTSGLSGYHGDVKACGMTSSYR